MKKYFLLSLKCLLVLALILGCSALQVKREVHENTFVSSNPNMAIKVNSEFKYVGDVSENGTSKSTTGRDLRIHFDSFCFVKPDKDQAGKAVIIQFHTTEYAFVSDFSRWVKNAVAKGTTDFEGKKFQYWTQSTYPSLNSGMTRQITEKGYKMPFGLVTVFGRIYGAKGNLLVKIYYYEPLDNSGIINSWENTDYLTPKQKDYLRDFNERAKSAFELMS